jgi:hypothetical protein
MKALFALLAIVATGTILLVACNGQSEKASYFQQQLDSLKLKVATQYAPGMGELMTTIQLHHAKLWFAGKNGNWALAAYDESLIQSAFKKIQRYHGATAEAHAATMIDVPMDSITAAIARQDGRAFTRSFTFLTTTCNNCHAVTKHPYNVIIIPHDLPVTNQDFSNPK